MKSGNESRRQKRMVNGGGILLSLCGVLACNYFGFGLGRVVCHGLLVASLGTPAHQHYRLGANSG